jgi:signal transduction histidine kinase
MSKWIRSAEQVRRSRFAYWVAEQRLADWTLRAVITRGVFAAVGLAAAIAAAVHGPALGWWAWLIVAVPFAGAYLAGRLAYYVKTGRMAAEPLARWASTVGTQTQGAMTVNISGLAESAGALGLAVLGPWVLVHASAPIRLLAVLGAAGWAGSYASAIMVDVAWYNPDLQSWLPLEFLRRCTGVVVAVLFAALTVPAPWPADGRLVCAAIAAALISIQLRVNETDRTLAFGDVYAGQRDLAGRRIVTTALHTLVGNPLIHLRRQTVHGDQAIFDLVRQVDGGYRETLALDRGVDVTMDWPGVLASRLDAIAGQYGISVSFSCPDDPMAVGDREVARFVLDDLTENAAKAGARLVSVELRRFGDRYESTITDDGPGFRRGTWLRPGGGLQRLAQLLESRGGTISMERARQGTAVTARWQTIQSGPEENTA